MKIKCKQIASFFTVALSLMLLMSALGAPLPAMSASAAASDVRLIPGGMPFGVKFSTEGVLVVGFCDVDTEGGTVNPAYAAGIRTRDVITSLGGKQVVDAAQFGSMVAQAGATPLTVTYTRGGKSYQATLTPAKSVSENRYKTGLWVRDSGAGIGTVTFIDPATGAFGGLGHGICDAESGSLVSMTRGVVNDVTISGVQKGVSGKPGELKGYFGTAKTGTLLSNTDCGVFGIFAKAPATDAAAMPIAKAYDVREGEAYILCTTDAGKPCKYTIRISDIDKTAAGSKCFTVKITDPALIEKTGGIVQGMSGSPIIQNGKLVGAVTHVLIGDPTTGYGIFIENMLNAAQMPRQKAA
ncbi:MAG: SpoIVB peptidase [Clostridia bacterium]|nr:SpoIVB peptidase [Clostridia bacterium]